MRRYWVSWWEPTTDGDARPLIVPPQDEVPHYWMSGSRQIGDVEEMSVCAVVDASNEAAAIETIHRYWVPKPDFRFVEERWAGWMPEPTRFPADKGPIRA